MSTFTAQPESPRTAAQHRSHADIFASAAVGSRENVAPVQRRLSGACSAPGSQQHTPRHHALRALKSPKVDTLTSPAVGEAPRRSSSRGAGHRTFVATSRKARHHASHAQNASSSAFVSGGRLDTSGHQNRVIQSAPQKVFLHGSQRAQTINVSDGVGVAVHSGALTSREQARAAAEDAKPINVGRKPVTARAAWGSNQAHTPTAVRVVGGANTVRPHEVDAAPNAHEKRIEAARGMRGGPKPVAGANKGGNLEGAGAVVAGEEPKQRPQLRQSPTTAKPTDPVVQSGAASGAGPQPRCSRPVPGAPQDRAYRTVHGAAGPALLLASNASSAATTPTSADPAAARAVAAVDDDEAGMAPHPHALQATRRHRIAGTRLIPSADNLLGAHSRRVLLLHAPAHLQAAGQAEAAGTAIAEERATRRYGIRPALAARHAVTLQGVHDGQPARRFKPRATVPSLGVGACLRLCVSSRAQADAARRSFITGRAINQPRLLN